MSRAEVKLRKIITENGPVSWREVMELALYNSEVGYYGSFVPPVGRTGDFYTSVSVGKLYGTLLAELALKVWRAAGEPEVFVIAEQAAHDGQLMADVRDAIQTLPLASSCRYVIIEPELTYQLTQRTILGTEVQWLVSVKDLRGVGLFYCNELLDALPVERVRFDGTRWEKFCVTLENDALTWCTQAMAQPPLPRHLPGGYITEYHVGAEAWAADLAKADWQGAVFLADYGYDEEEYYSYERNAGTLRRYFQHRSDAEILQNLGEADLTAHVNFTPILKTLHSAGWRTDADLPQGRFLSRLAVESLLRHSSPKKARQLMALTHPGHLGAVFRNVLLSRGLNNSSPLFRIPT
jgi:SAM-dependent MidA family methyltransferase